MYPSELVFFNFFKKSYLFERERERMRTEGEEEADSPLSRETDAELNPRTLRPRPEPKADTQSTEPPRRPTMNFLK